ncbi:efflux RND transporter permease subunit [Curvibacter sp. RS43]|uniref:efflux RND transporter permease subunit n=1 Tax=Curvibacter microcysteis TaxID=3026419 RepID=UPI00235F0149|nr:efflux RND transporter permease subunit [Curvibacter sp. RS43]MDD0812361.1 efflux RND transporter permease subunit [Curvibacter sp. RS43]
MSNFFISRPIFAWVIALFVVVLGCVSITQLPIAQYPPVAPPSVVLSITYPGASAETLKNSVITVIEQQMNGATGMLYMESVAQANGTGTITLSFDPSIDPDMAQVDVQNRLSAATPRLPAAVNQQGVLVTKASNNFLLFLMLSSDDPNTNPIDIGDYVARNVMPEIQRIEGVGQVQQFGTEHAMRIWLNPSKLVSYGLSPADVNSAIAAQNAQVASGVIGDLPQVPTQEISATVLVDGQLASVEAFGDIVLRANPDGSSVRVKDVARLEIGGASYATSARLNGKPASGLGVQPANKGNALATATAVRKKMQELERYFPKGMKWAMPYDTSTFVKISIGEVTETLFEALLLVFVVMFLFLQNVRYTIIPAIVVPVALLGGFTTMLMMGLSINVLTMFAMVLVIGIVVDDAIVVVEAVERIMADEGLPPVEAARKAMGQISGAIVGITVVLISVFVPLAFFSGSVGNIYRQLSVVMVSSIACSAFLALTLTPALCGSMLKPVTPGSEQKQKGFFGWFNRSFERTAGGYESWVTRLLKKAGRYLVIYVAIIAAALLIFERLPTSFLPDEDQGNIMVNVQLPPGATAKRTLEVVQEMESFILQQPEVKSMISVLGYSFSGNGQNAGLAFVTLKDWKERLGPEHSAQALVKRTFVALLNVRDAFILPLSPAPIPELGNSTGFTFRLQDRSGKGHAALNAARDQLLGAALKSPLLSQVRVDGLDDAPQLQLHIDRQKAQAQGVSFSTINTALSTLMGSDYVNDFPSNARMQRVLVQADAPYRMQSESLLEFLVPSNAGKLVPLSTFASTSWTTGPMQSVRYNGYDAVRISGNSAPGHSTGEAMAEMERLAAELPAGFGYEWTGQSLQENSAGSQSMVLYGFALLAVFLCLAALYESWTIPISVLMVVPLGLLGTVVATLLRSYANDVYFQVGLITIIGLSAKNAIMIVEYAKDTQASGKGIVESALEAVRLRFRPIIMTSLAFALGVVPLAMASGAGSASQRAIGTGVLGGILIGTTLAVFFVPIFFVVVRTLFKRRGPQTPAPSTPSGASHD